MTTTIREAQQHLHRLVRDREPVVITVARRPAAALIPLPPQASLEAPTVRPTDKAGRRWVIESASVTMPEVTSTDPFSLKDAGVNHQTLRDYYAEKAPGRGGSVAQGEERLRAMVRDWKDGSPPSGYEIGQAITAYLESTDYPKAWQRFVSNDLATYIRNGRRQQRQQREDEIAELQDRLRMYRTPGHELEVDARKQAVAGHGPPVEETIDELERDIAVREEALR